MNRRLIRVIACAGAAGVAAFAVYLELRRQPLYQGKTLSQWMEALETDPAFARIATVTPLVARTTGSHPNDLPPNLCREALLAMGPEVYPVLLGDLSATDSTYGTWLNRCLEAIPWLDWKLKPASVRQQRGLMAASLLSTNLLPILPKLLDLTSAPTVGRSLSSLVLGWGRQQAEFREGILAWSESAKPNVVSIGLVRQLGDRDPRSQQFLLRGVQSREPDVRRVAMRILRGGVWNDDDVVRVLITSLEDGEGDVRHMAAYALAQCRPIPASAVAALAGLLHGPDEEMQLVGVYALEEVGLEHPAALAALRGAAEHPRRVIREAVIRVLDDWIARTERAGGGSLRKESSSTR